jgi:hypothetical protein
MRYSEAIHPPKSEKCLEISCQGFLLGEVKAIQAFRKI